MLTLNIWTQTGFELLAGVKAMSEVAVVATDVEPQVEVGPLASVGPKELGTNLSVVGGAALGVVKGGELAYATEDASAPVLLALEEYQPLKPPESAEQPSVDGQRPWVTRLEIAGAGSTTQKHSPALSASYFCWITKHGAILSARCMHPVSTLPPPQGVYLLMSSGAMGTMKQISVWRVKRGACVDFDSDGLCEDEE